MTRVKASSIHLSVSVIIASLLFWLLITQVYPHPLLRAMGGVDIFLLLVGIDIILGPLLTFIVYKENKRSLRFDLTVVVIVQVVALIYGIVKIWEGRPAFIVSSGGRFDAVQISEIPEEERVGPYFMDWSLRPKWVAIKMPSDPEERSRMLDLALHGMDYQFFPKYYDDLSVNTVERLERSWPITLLKKLNPDRLGEIDRWFQQRGVSPADSVYQGLSARGEDMAVVMDKKTGKIIGVAPFRPWQ